MNWFAGVAVIIALGLEAFFVHQYDAYKYEAAWNKFQAQSTQAVSDAQSTARAQQAKEDAQRISQANAAVTHFEAVSAATSRQVADLKSHTKAVSNVPEVRKFRCTPIPGALLAGLPDGPGSRGCDDSGPGEVHTDTPGTDSTHHHKL